MNPVAEKYYKAYTDALPIFDRYREMEDPLAKDLFAWEARTFMSLRMILDDEVIGDEDKENRLIETARSCIQIFDQIFRAQINFSILKSPYFVDEMEAYDFVNRSFVKLDVKLTWNFETLSTYMSFVQIDQEIYGVDKKEIKISENFFAKELCEWRKGLENPVAEIPKSEAASLLDALVESHEMKPEVIANFLRRASGAIFSAVSIEKSKQKQRERVERIERMRAERAERAARRETEKVQEEKRKEEHEAFMKEEEASHEKARSAQEEKVAEEIREIKKKTEREKAHVAEMKKEASKIQEEAKSVYEERSRTVDQNLALGKREVDAFYERRKRQEYGGVRVMQQIDRRSRGFCLIL
ncbi:MAG TPA: hypothetical protein VJK48_00680 [Chlamydiales bacterium]|nr:hypothetical protein [Chlamydiales bacterium]